MRAPSAPVGCKSAQVGNEMQTGGAGGDKRGFGGAPRIRSRSCQSSLEQELSKIFISQNIPVRQDPVGSELVSCLPVLPGVYSSRSNTFPETLEKRWSFPGLCSIPCGMWSQPGVGAPPAVPLKSLQDSAAGRGCLG